MTEFEFELSDRITKIQSINEQYDLENNAYISFSGGKDSVILSVLVDLALPNNKIPRLFLNTGLEYNELLHYVQRKAKEDSRIVLHNSGVNIPAMLKQYGYPFKSKEHSQILEVYQKTKITMTEHIKKYLSKDFMGCPDKLKYQFTPDFKLKVSDKCCYNLKKMPANNWAKENNKTITMTGIRQDEKGLRWNKTSCTIFSTDGELKKFHPLLPVSDNFEDEFIKTYNIELCELYYPPFNFKRTGCKGCPFQRELRFTLETMQKFMPAQKKQCEKIWEPVYSEYRRIGFRLYDNFSKGNLNIELEKKVENGETLYKLKDIALLLGLIEYKRGKAYPHWQRIRNIFTQHNIPKKGKKDFVNMSIIDILCEHSRSKTKEKLLTTIKETN